MDMETYIFKWDCLVICIVILQYTRKHIIRAALKNTSKLFFLLPTFLVSICTTIVYISNAWLVWLIKGEEKRRQRFLLRDIVSDRMI